MSDPTARQAEFVKALTAAGLRGAAADVQAVAWTLSRGPGVPAALAALARIAAQARGRVVAVRPAPSAVAHKPAPLPVAPPAPPLSAWEEIEAKAAALAKAEPHMTPQQAVARVASAHPELYDRYVAEERARRAKRSA